MLKSDNIYRLFTWPEGGVTCVNLIEIVCLMQYNLRDVF